MTDIRTSPIIKLQANINRINNSYNYIYIVIHFILIVNALTLLIIHFVDIMKLKDWYYSIGVTSC